MGNSTLWDSTMLSALVSLIVTTLTTIAIEKITSRKQQREKLKENFNEILKISIEYPYLEYKKFCNDWSPNNLTSQNSDQYIRYDNYAVLVFNHLEDVCLYYKYDENKIKKNHVDIKNWLRLHKKVWETPLGGEFENTDGYSQKFREFVNNLIGD